MRKLGHPPAYEENALGGWRLQPNLRKADLSYTRAREHNFVLNSNEDGLRTTLERERNPYSWRLAILGDSTTMGWGVNAEDSLGEVIAARLQSISPLNIEVLNGAQPGYSTWQAIWLYAEVIQHYRPDAVLLFLPLHDQNQVLISDRESQEGGNSLTAKTRVWLATNSRIYANLRKLRYNRAADVQLPAEGMTKERRVDRVPVEDRIESVERFKALNESRSVPILLGQLPSYGDLKRTSAIELEPRAGLQAVQAYADQQGISMLNMRACCGGDADAMVFPFDEGHYSVKGNRLIGEAIADQLIALGLPSKQYSTPPEDTETPEEAPAETSN